MNIRIAKPDDAPKIYSLILSATKRGKILKRPLREVRKAIRHFWVVEEGSEIVACCAIEIYNKKLAEIRSLVVLPAHQKKGIATKLIAHSLKEAKKKKIYEVLAITDRENIF